MKILGVIGGLGPMATAFFMRMVIEMTKAQTDQEHIEMLIHSRPQIPDRTNYILGLSDKNPIPDMVQVGRALEDQGADLIAIPCITAHYFYGELCREIDIPIIHIVSEIRDYLIERGVESVGLLATSGTVASNLFQEMFADCGCRLLLPSGERQKDVMHLIYKEVKASRAVDMNRFFRISSELREAGAQVIILGCTELSIIRRDFSIGSGYLDAMQLLAKCSVEFCGTLKEEYRELIT